MDREWFYRLLGVNPHGNFQDAPRPGSDPDLAAFLANPDSRPEVAAAQPGPRMQAAPLPDVPRRPVRAPMMPAQQITRADLGLYEPPPVVIGPGGVEPGTRAAPPFPQRPMPRPPLRVRPGGTRGTVGPEQFASFVDFQRAAEQLPVPPNEIETPQPPPLAQRAFGVPSAPQGPSFEEQEAAIWDQALSNVIRSNPRLNEARGLPMRGGYQISDSGKPRTWMKQGTLMPSNVVAQQQQDRRWETNQPSSMTDPDTGWPIDPITGEPVAPMEWQMRLDDTAALAREDESRVRERMRWDVDDGRLRVRIPLSRPPR